MCVGGSTYRIDTARLPYFEAFSNFQQLAGRDLIHDSIPYFDHILYGFEHGYRHFFQRMPADLEAYHVLCETPEFLGVDVLGGMKLRDVFEGLRRWKKPLTPITREPREPNLSESRNAAFHLVCLFLMEDLDLNDFAGRHSNFAYQVVLQVHTNSSIFDLHTRRVV